MPTANPQETESFHPSRESSTPSLPPQTQSQQHGMLKELYMPPHIKVHYQKVDTERRWEPVPQSPGENIPVLPTCLGSRAWMQEMRRRREEGQRGAIDKAVERAGNVKWTADTKGTNGGEQNGPKRKKTILQTLSQVAARS